MKTLTLVRHAHAHPSQIGEEDIDRHIDTQGIEQAHEIAIQLKNSIPPIEHVITSPAVRAQETAKLLCQTLEYTADLAQDKRIFINTLDELLRLVHELDDKYQHVMLVGHNPGFSQLGAYLSGDSGVNLSTCGSCILVSEKNCWDDLNFSAAKINLILSPSQPDHS